jgi:2'-5' RNA ligase
MRLFTAINFDKETKEYLAGAAKLLQSAGVDGNYTRPENFHLTLIFLGEQPPARISAIRRAMEAAAANVTPFDLMAEGMGTFRSGIVWAGIKPCPPLLLLWKDLSDGLMSEGFQFRAESYRPHLTLCREARITEKLPDIEISKRIDVPKISLMKSEYIGGRLIYTELETVLLGE